MNELTVSSPSKINLWLRVLGRREDGFHEVRTRMLRLSLTDTLHLGFDARGEGIQISCDDPSVPTDGSNLVAVALRAFMQRSGIQGGWRARLEKRVPAGAGLGGGSGNAAAALLAANEITGHPLDEADLLSLAGGIGADVAFFVLNTAAADAGGRGEQVSRVEGPGEMPMVLVKPAFPVPTPWAYSRWKDSRELPGVLYAPQITPWGALVNDLERPVFEKHLALPSLKNWLLGQTSCLAALMSGSGSTMFAIAGGGTEAAQLAEQARHYAGATAWISVVTAGV